MLSSNSPRVPLPEPGNLPHPVPTPPPPVPAFKASNFTFRLDSFEIENTRSRHEDTDYVSCSFALGSAAPQTKTKSMGDLNNGTYPVGISFGPVTISSPTEVAIFNYLIVNAGHEDWSTIDGMITKAGSTLAKAGADAAASAAGAAAGTLLGAEIGGVVVPIIGPALGALAGWVVGEITGLVTADCDGPVAAEQLVVTGAQLWASTQDANKTWSHQTYQPGTDSAAGCGSNSIYLVNWSVVRS